MAGVLYFSESNGEAVSLIQTYSMPNAEFQAAFPGIKGLRYDSFSRRVGRDEAGRVLPLLRVIEYKANPSKHKCDDRCLHAKGKTMKCECSCGGRNHGRGAIVCD